MLFEPTTLQDAFVVKLQPRGDERGWFSRSMCVREFEAHGLDTVFVQQNVSRSRDKGTLRGMHRQIAPHEEAKLIRVLSGAIWDVIIDLRPDSATYKKWEGFHLEAGDGRQLYAPRGFAHGFITLTDEVEVSYLVSAFYAPEAERGLRWDDPAFAVEWPIEPKVISEKDRNWPAFRD